MEDTAKDRTDQKSQPTHREEVSLSAIECHEFPMNTLDSGFNVRLSAIVVDSEMGPKLGVNWE